MYPLTLDLSRSRGKEGFGKKHYRHSTSPLLVNLIERTTGKNAFPLSLTEERLKRAKELCDSMLQQTAVYTRTYIEVYNAAKSRRLSPLLYDYFTPGSRERRWIETGIVPGYGERNVGYERQTTKAGEAGAWTR